MICGLWSVHVQFKHKESELLPNLSFFFYETAYYGTRISTTYKRNKIGNIRITKHCSALALFLYLLGYLSRWIPFHSAKALWYRQQQNVRGSSCKVPDVFVRFQQNVSFRDRFSRKCQLPNFECILSVGGAGILADGHDEVNRRFSRICERAGIA